MHEQAGMTRQCEAIYIRPETRQPVRCTYLMGHPSPEHSWRTLRMQEERDKEEQDQALATGPGPRIGHDDDTPEDVRVLLDNIAAGHADPYLEAILAVTHNRKRALRGVRGFGDL